MTKNIKLATARRRGPKEPKTEAGPEAAFAAAKKLIVAAKGSQTNAIRFTRLRDLDQLPNLDGCETLEKLDLSYTKVSDISEVSKLTNLSSLELRGAPVSDISPLTGMSSLRKLGLTDCPINDTKTIATLSNLEELAAGNTRIVNIAPLKSLKKLSVLYLWETPVVDFSPIAKLTTLRALSLIKSKIKDSSFLQSLDKLEELLLARTKISDLSPLSSLTQLRRLDLSDTRIKDLAKLSNLKKLRDLDISGTKISQLSPLSKLHKLQSLNVYRTRVSDLSPIAPLLSLVKGASSRNGGLSFLGSPISDSTVNSFANLPNPARTVSTISYLRRQQGLSMLPEVSDTGDNEIVGLAAQLEQNPLGAQFEPVDDYLEIAASGVSTDREVAKNITTQQLHEQVKRKADELASKAMRLANQPGWQAAAATSERFRRLVQRDIESVADQIAEVWGELVSLGSFLEQDTDLRQKRDGFTEPLEPEQRRPLVDLLQTAGPWVRRFPTARELDDQHASFHERRDELSGARELLSVVQYQKVIQRNDADMFETALGGNERLGHQTKKAHAFGVFSVRNIAYRVIGIAAAGLATGATAYVGSETAKGLVLTQKAVRLIVSAEEPLLRFLSGLPADIRAGVRALLDTLRGESHGVPLPRRPSIEAPVKRQRGSNDDETEPEDND
jgi:Leucine Rich repeats (2 copies)